LLRRECNYGVQDGLMGCLVDAAGCALVVRNRRPQAAEIRKYSLINTLSCQARNRTILIGELCKLVAAPRRAGEVLEAPLIVAAWQRLRRLETRFASLVDRWRAGKLRACGAAPRPPASGRTTASGRVSAAPRAPAAPSVLPRGRGWLLRLDPQGPKQAAYFKSLLLGHPELPTLIAAAPQVGRILRPLCHMLNVEPPPELALPRKPQEAPTASEPSAQDPPPQPATPDPPPRAPGEPMPAAAAEPPDQAPPTPPPRPPTSWYQRPGGLVLVDGKLTWW
jgi:hypothetical protein